MAYPELVKALEASWWLVKEGRLRSAEDVISDFRSNR